MESWADRQLAMLREHYAGTWDVWYVPNYPSGYTWCAKPVGWPVATINVKTPEELVRVMAERERNLRS